jgi:flagellar hook protein FlgE
MSFNIALSGLNAAQKDLDVTSNNIANVNTVGFKQSRAEFVDVYASSLLASGNTKVGDGVITSDVAQQFGQGSIRFTENSLDLAIAGNGFFATVPEIGSQETSYTRSGQFKLNDSGFITNSGGLLLGYGVNSDGSSSSVSIGTASPIQIPSASGAPSQTTDVNMKMNLPAGSPYITGAPGNFDPNNTSTYNATTSVNIYDSLGESHQMNYFYVKDNPSIAPNQWLMFAAIDGKAINLEQNPAVQLEADALVATETAARDAAKILFDAIATPTDADVATLAAANQSLADAISATTPEGGVVSGNLSPGGVTGARLTFNSSGDFISQVPSIANGGIKTAAFGTSHLTNGSDPTQSVKVDFNLDPAGPNLNEPTQWNGVFERNATEQNGLAVGRLTGIEIGNDGLVVATYSNGTDKPLARIAMVSFANNQGLSQAGNSTWKSGLSSGNALAGEAGTGTFGNIQSQALEQSNVNLTTELIDLISAQRNFQANSRSLEVDNQLNQTILQIR